MNIYRVSIDDDNLGMEMISLVHYPAIEKNFIAMSKQEKEDMSRIRMSFNEERHEVTGPMVLNGIPIYRFDERGEYFIVFDGDTIRKMMTRYFRSGFSNRTSIEHDGNELEDMVMIESYAKDSGRGIVPHGYDDVPDGSWFVTYKVFNDDVWKRIKSGEVLGFSLEGFFELIPLEDVDMSKEQSYDEWLDALTN